MITRFYLSFLSVILIVNAGFCQEKKLVLKSWIKREIYDLSRNQKVDDTMYTRYTFSNDVVYLCFYPAWNDNPQPWNLSGDVLTIRQSPYTVETLTDSTLIIAISGFRRIVLDAEDYLIQKAASPRIVDSLNGEPVYEATPYLTPRYKNEEFRRTIEQNLEGYNIQPPATFTASFVVKKDGTVDKVQVIHGFTSGFDAEVCKQLKKTSKKWKPAIYEEHPVQSQLTYTIKYIKNPFVK